MKNDNQYMNNNCEQIQILIEDYLDGMISTADKKLMESHISGCSECKSYLEHTVMLVNSTRLIAKGDKLPDKTKSAIWNKIESKITSKSIRGDSRIFNLSGLEDEYVPALKNDEEKFQPLRWSTIKYYVSGLAAVFALAFIIYMVSQFRQGSDINMISNGVVDIGTRWKVTTVKGTPMINNIMMKNIDSIAEGQFLITDSSSQADLTVASLGTVTIEPNSKIRFVKSAGGEHRIELVYGSIDANILAKPRSFFVDAGKVTAVDLGCSYKISLDRSGDGLLYVKSGRVSLESAGGRESIVPEGKFCVLKKDIGPGTPFRGDSSPKFKQALMDFDFGECGSQCVNVILKNSKKTDAVTLINIIPRVDKEYKTIVYDKVANYCPPPKNLPKDSISKFDKIEQLNEWVDKVMEEVHKNIKQNMKVLEENMKHFDHEKWSKDWEKDFNFKFAPMDSSIYHDFNFSPSPEEMKELQEDLNEMKKEMIEDNEEFKKEMEQLKEELKKVNEEIKMENFENRKELKEKLKEKMKEQQEMKHKEKERMEQEENENEKELEQNK